MGHSITTTTNKCVITTITTMAMKTTTTFSAILVLLLVALYYMPQQGALAQDTEAVATPPAGPLATLITQFTSMSPFELMNMTMQALVVAPLVAFAPAAEHFNASITETLRAFEPLTERVSTDINNTLRAFAPAAEDFARALNETGANVTAALEAVAPNRTANTNPTRRNLLDAEVVAANA